MIYIKIFFSFSGPLLYYDYKGQPRLQYRGHIFRKNKSYNNNTTIFWICSKKYKTKCNYSVITKNGFIQESYKSMIHNHGPDE